MIIDCAHYLDGRRRDEGAVSLEEAAARSRHGGFVWLGLFEPGDEELAEVRDTFGLHDLKAFIVGEARDAVGCKSHPRSVSVIA